MLPVEVKGPEVVMTIWSAAVLLFLVMDPLSNVPTFLAVLKDLDRRQYRRVVLRELVIALAFMLVFLFAGSYVLDLLHISGYGLSIAGGLILLLIAIRLIFPPGEGVFGRTPEGEPFIVPLAVPLIAGPSTLVTIMLLASREPQRWPQWLLAIGLAWLISAGILIWADQLKRVLKEHGLIAMERLMGLILTAVAVQMLLSGIEEAVHAMQLRQGG